jgi:DNA polymerase alpha subunit A
MCGRLICDTLVSAKEFLRETTYTLTNLARAHLKATRQEIDINSVGDMLTTTADVLALSDHTLNDCKMTLGLMHSMVVLPLTLQLTALAGSLWTGSLRSARADRVENLLLHEFHRLKYILPEKYSSKEKREKEDEVKEMRGLKVEEKKSGKRRGKPQYAGGLVLEPKVGFYDKFVLLLDFNSLYPSIIQEYNICFTTIKHWEVTTDDGRHSISLCHTTCS